MSWVKETIDDKSIFGAKSFTYAYSCIDAASVVHGNTISHTGGAIPIGHGVFHKKASV